MFTTFDPFDELMNLEVYVLMKEAMKRNKENDNQFGYLPLMCKDSPCQLGALTSRSFVDRMNSRGNLIVTKNRTRLGSDFLQKLIVLNMNKRFMATKTYNPMNLIDP